MERRNPTLGLPNVELGTRQSANAPSVHSRPGSRAGTTPQQKRRETLLTLLDALNELKDEHNVGVDKKGESTFVEAEGDIITQNNEQLQMEGAAAFKLFQTRMQDLDKALRNFANAARQLGSSVGILSAIARLRERLASIIFLFRENAACLFPRKVHLPPRLQKEYVTSQRRAKSTIQRFGRKMSSQLARPVVLESLDAEDFPSQLEAFALNLKTLLKTLNDFPEFTDEALNRTIESFEGDLLYWAASLELYKGQFKYPAVQRYLHDLGAEMGEHLDGITHALSMFIEVGIPAIRFSQRHTAQNLLNLSTIATFFSAVTATTMQFSFDRSSNALEVSVNVFWFSSLVFSIASAVNSLLGLTWKQALYRSPKHRVPWWVSMWIKRSPLAFLVISVAAFSIGLVLFAWSTQKLAARIITTVFTCCSSAGLAAVSLWFTCERWTFSRHRGQKWLADVISEVQSKLYHVTGMKWAQTVPPVHLKRAQTWGSTQARRIFGMSSVNTGRVRFPWRRRNSSSDLEQMPVANSEAKSPVSERRMFPPADTEISPARPQEGASTTVASSATDTRTPNTPGRARFIGVVKSVMMMQTNSGPKSPKRQRTLSSTMSPSETSRPRRETIEPLGALRGARITSLISSMKHLNPVQDIPAHQALVRHVQFSPDGKWLATCSWDRTAVLFRVGDPVLTHRVLAHPSGFVGQVAWSPNGTHLLTKLPRGIKVWTQDGVCKRTIDRRHPVQSVAWFANGKAFLSVEGSKVYSIDLAGNCLSTYEFERMAIHDVVVTPDSERILAVATMLESPSGRQPSRARAEKRIFVYNLEEREVESQVPLLNEVRDITLAKDSLIAVVSYENKAPPQLWRVDMVKVPGEPRDARLTLMHTYMPKVPVDFAGPSYFGGNNDQLVFCAGKAGDLYFWDRDTGALLRHMRPEEAGGDLTCIGATASAGTFMFATGSHDGVLRIWASSSKPIAIPNITTESPGEMLDSPLPFDFDDTPQRAASPEADPSL